MPLLELVRHLPGAFCLLALVTASTIATAAQATPPLATLHARLTVADTVVPLSPGAITAVVNRAWAAQGVRLVWTLGGAGWDGIDLWVHLRHKPIVDADGALGMVHFHDGKPRRFIQIDVGDIVKRVERGLASELHLQPASVFNLMFAGGRQLTERAVGYSVAHEIGHVLLGPDHASSGLMRATMVPWQIRPGDLRLDAASQARLKAALARRGS